MHDSVQLRDAYEIEHTRFLLLIWNLTFAKKYDVPLIKRTLTAIMGMVSCATPLLAQEAAEPVKRLRVVMTTDFPPIGVVKGGDVPNDQKSDPDDMQSMVRFLLYANEFDIEALIATAGTFANKAKKENILAVIDRYAQVHDNLKKYDPLYPDADYLRSVTFEGLSGTWGKKGTANIGEGKDSEASDALIAIVDKPDPRPVYVGVWGDCSVVAQAVWKVRKTRSADALDKFLDKLRIHQIATQDGTIGWLRDQFPNLFIIHSAKTYQGMFGGRFPETNLAWVNENIRKDHGALCDVYPHEGMGCTGVCEGDTPAFLWLVSANRGLNDPDDPTQESWGGQFVKDGEKNHYIDGPGGSSISRWRKAYQKEFQERADWCVEAPEEKKQESAGEVSSDGWKKIAAANFDSSGGSLDASGDSLFYVKPAAWTKYDNVDLHEGTTAVEMNVANGGSDSAIQVWVSGKLVGTLKVKGTGGWNDYQTQNIRLDAPLSGVQNVKLVFVNGHVNVGWLRFSESTVEAKEPAPAVDQELSQLVTPTVNADLVGGGYKPRIINTTDLGADPDDEQSMVRQLVCANEFDIEGLIVATGCWKKSQSDTAMLDKILEAYGQSIANLSVHAEGFPSLDYLKSVSVMGQKGYGMSDVGTGKDSPGSELIIASVDKDDPRPVWVMGWGGMNNIAQALWKVRETRSAEEFKKFRSKMRLYDILGQDDAGAWIARNFPDILYIRATGVYGWQPPKNGAYQKEDIQRHGPLGAVYPDTKWASEGDTPAFMHVYPNGLNDPDQIDQGGWGGRFSFTRKAGIRSMSGVARIRKDGEAQYDPYFMHGNTAEKARAIKRWSNGYNNDFAARMDWSITSKYEDANHHPVAILNGDKSRKVLEMSVSPGSRVELNAEGSSDPDGDSLSYSWSFYKEPSSYRGAVEMENITSPSSIVTVPSDAEGKTIHVILEVHDDGSPSLYAYRRVILKAE